MTTPKAKATRTAGMKLEISTTASSDPSEVGLTFVDLALTMKEVQNQGGTTDEVDISTLACEDKEYELGLSDSGTYSLSGNLKIGDPAQDILHAARADKLARVLRTTFKDGSTVKNAILLTQISWGAQTGGVASVSCNARATGAPVFEEAVGG